MPTNGRLYSMREVYLLEYTRPAAYLALERAARVPGERADPTRPSGHAHTARLRAAARFGRAVLFV